VSSMQAQPVSDSASPAPGHTPRMRRIGDKILAAFEHASERNELEVAALLLIEYERVVTRIPISLGGERRREMESLISAHNRLWELLRSSVAA
jgi:hypothetical protein